MLQSKCYKIIIEKFILVQFNEIIVLAVILTNERFAIRCTYPYIMLLAGVAKRVASITVEGHIVGNVS